MLNVSSERRGMGGGVWLRALEPLEGIERMRHHRCGTCKVRDIARGPGRLATALRIDRRHDGLDLCADGPVWLGTAARRTGPITRSARIGVTREAHRLLRFSQGGNTFLTGSKRI